jgi:iron complex outermembrane recepter protein
MRTIAPIALRFTFPLASISASSLAVALCFATSVPAFAQEARFAFDIPAQDLEVALKDFGRTTKVELIYDPRKVDSKTTRIVSKELKGSFTAKDGLVRMLEGTGFSVKTGASGVLIIEGGQAPAPARSQSGNGDADGKSVEMATRGIAEILVIGQRTQNSDIRRSEDDAQPYQVFSRQEIQRSQATTLEDFFRTRLTTNTVVGSESQRTSGVINNGAGSSRSSINLRGLGTNQTLILVDGRRLADLSIQGNNLSVTGSGQPDINGIPLASIERIEVLSSTAGGIYGGNAVGGVINIILRRDYRGVELTANYQNTGDFKYPSTRLDINGGAALEDGRTNITFSGSSSRSDVLKVGDRDFSQRAFALGLRNAPEQFIERDPAGDFVNLVPVARGVNITTNAAALTLKPAFGGGNIGSAFTNVPVGFTGSPAAFGAALRANAGNFNFEQPHGNNGAERSLFTAPETQSFNVNIRRKFTDSLDIFADYNNFVNKGSAFASTQPPTQITLSPTSPSNPFNETINVIFDNKNLASPSQSESDTRRATLGFNMRLPHRWALGFDSTWNWAQTTSSFYRIPIDLAGRACAQIGIAPANVGPANAGQCPAPFGNAGDTRPAVNVLLDPDFTQYKLTRPTDTTDYKTTLFTPTLRGSGPLIDLAAGPVNFSGLLQRSVARTKHGLAYTSVFYNRNDETPAQQTFTVFAPAEQVSTSVYGELNIPIFGSRNAATLLQDLSIQLSVRNDRFNTTQSRIPVGRSTNSFAEAITAIGSNTQSARNSASNFTGALKYSPIDDLAFRVSYGSGFLQPNVNQVVTNSQTITPGGTIRIPDPLRGNTVQSTPFEFISGGVFEFRPEQSKSYSAGAIITPSLLPGFRFSADYSLTKKTNEITSINVLELLANADLYPGRVVRAPLSPADIAAGYRGGPLTLINQAQINLFRSRVASFDFKADYDFAIAQVGRFQVYAAATYQPEFERQLSATRPIVNASGFSNGPLKWRGNGGISWTTGGLVVQYNMQYYNPYFVYDSGSAQAVIDDATKLQGSNRIPSQVYHDLFASYAFATESGITKGLRLSAGVQNIFNKSPPIVATTFYSQGGYSGYGDPRLRRFSVTLTKAF